MSMNLKFKFCQQFKEDNHANESFSGSVFIRQQIVSSSNITGIAWSVFVSVCENCVCWSQYRLI